MTIAGLDISSKQIDCCLLNLDDDQATWHEWPIAAKDALQAARNVRDALPARGWWADTGCVMYATESLWSHGRNTLKVLSRISGAVIACLDPSLELIELSPHEWRQHSVGGNASKAEIRQWVFHKWLEMGSEWLPTQDQADAYCIAFACRALCERAAGEVA